VVIGDVDPRAEGTASDITAAGGRSLFQETDDHYGWSMDLPHQQRLHGADHENDHRSQQARRR
jgi:hypothetical protein